MSWSRRAFACSAASAAAVRSRLRCAIISAARSEPIVTTTRAALEPAPSRSTARRGTISTLSRQSTRNPRIHCSRSAAVRRSSMIRTRPTLLIATAAAIASPATAAAPPPVVHGSVADDARCEALNAARPPSAERRRQTASVRRLWVEEPGGDAEKRPSEEPCEHDGRSRGGVPASRAELDDDPLGDRGQRDEGSRDRDRDLERTNRRATTTRPSEHRHERESERDTRAARRIGHARRWAQPGAGPSRPASRRSSSVHHSHQTAPTAV